MTKELEEAKQWIQERIVYIAENCDLNDSDNKRAYDNLKAVLNYIDNSISKEVIENYLKDEKEKFEVYKKESENNENLKGQMWHHMGAKNMCERILGIEKLVTLD